VTNANQSGHDIACCQLHSDYVTFIDYFVNLGYVELQDVKGLLTVVVFVWSFKCSWVKAAFFGSYKLTWSIS